MKLSIAHLISPAMSFKQANFFILVLFILTMTGCSTIAPTPSGQDFVTYQKASRPPLVEGMGLLYFYRENRLIGSAWSFSLYEGSQRIGWVKSGSYFTYYAKPGEHTFWAQTEAKASITLDVKPGKAYYVRVGIVPFTGFWAPNPSFVQASSEAFDKEFSELSYTKLHKQGPRP